MHAGVPNRELKGGAYATSLRAGPFKKSFLLNVYAGAANRWLKGGAYATPLRTGRFKKEKGGGNPSRGDATGGFLGGGNPSRDDATRRINF